MKKVYIVLAVLCVFTMSLFVITCAQQITIKSDEVYSYYFNDSRVVDKIYTEYTANEMARELSGFMKTWRPEKFDITEDTGYDIESVFTDEDAYNMMCVKKAVDNAFLVCIGSFVLTAAMYFILLKAKRRKMVRTSYIFSMLLSIAGIAAQIMAAGTYTGRERCMAFLNMNVLEEKSELAAILGPGFCDMAVIFFGLFSLVILAVVTYIAFLLSKPERIFSNRI